MFKISKRCMTESIYMYKDIKSHTEGQHIDFLVTVNIHNPPVCPLGLMWTFSKERCLCDYIINYNNSLSYYQTPIWNWINSLLIWHLLHFFASQRRRTGCNSSFIHYDRELGHSLGSHSKKSSLCL